MSSLRERVLNRIINDTCSKGFKPVNPMACAEQAVDVCSNSELLERISDALEELIEDLAREKRE